MRRDDGAVGLPVTAVLNRLAAGLACVKLVVMGDPVPRSLAGQSSQSKTSSSGMTDDQRRQATLGAQGTCSGTEAVERSFEESAPQRLAALRVCKGISGDGSVSLTELSVWAGTRRRLKAEGRAARVAGPHWGKPI
jgi:hypothetical protein